MQPEPGTVVGGRYRLEALLASGGMGSVWRARHLELDADVAVKLMSPEMLDTPAGEKRFRREAQAAARLRSPHIVRVFDYGTFEGQPYLTMELLEGEDLASHLDAYGPLPVERCVEIVDGVARALQLAHEAGIVHRDLKPANIFLERAGDQEVVKVLDFGVAKDIKGGAQAAGTTGTALVGSPAYMSPEQVWGEAIGPECDVWAMGVVCYETLTGENPFMHEVLAQVFDRIVKAKVPSPREKNPRLPEGLDAFFARALARSAKDRFESPRALADALRVALGQAGAKVSRTATARDASETLGARVTRDVPPRRRQSGLVWGAVAFGALALASFLIYSNRSDHAPSVPSSQLTPPAEPAPAAIAPVASAAAPASPPPSAPASASAVPRVRVSPPRTAAPAPSQAPTATPTLDPKWGVPVGSQPK